MPRFKPLLDWEPLPFLVAIALLLLTGVVRPDSESWLVWSLAAGIVAAVVWLLVSTLRGRGRNPDRWGDLSTLDGLTIVDVPSRPVADPAGPGGTVRTAAEVIDTERHRSSIELAVLEGGERLHAVLVPRASRWMSPRYRVGVQLAGGARPRHAGFLDDATSARWAAILDAERARGVYARVPAQVRTDGGRLRVELDLSGMERFEGLVRGA